MLNLTHLLQYVIEFNEPVDLFDVIYQLKIQTRTDFKSDQKKIIICSLNPIPVYGEDPNHISNRFSNNKFISNYGNAWVNHHVRLTNFERGFRDEEEKLKEYWIEEHEGTIDGFYEHYNNIIELVNEFEKACDNIELTVEEINLMNHIKNFPAIKSNIKFIGWKDAWVCD